MAKPHQRVGEGLDLKSFRLLLLLFGAFYFPPFTFLLNGQRGRRRRRIRRKKKKICIIARLNWTAGSSADGTKRPVTFLLLFLPWTRFIISFLFWRRKKEKNEIFLVISMISSAFTHQRDTRKCNEKSHSANSCRQPHFKMTTRQQTTPHLVMNSFDFYKVESEMVGQGKNTK